MDGDRLVDARSHLVEAGDHIARALEQIAAQEAGVARGPRDDRAARTVKRLLRARKDGLATIHKHLNRIGDELDSLVAIARLGRRADTSGTDHSLRRVA